MKKDSAETSNTASISIEGKTPPIVWSSITSSTDIVAGNGYLTNGENTIILTLPVRAAVDDIFDVMGGSQHWIIAQNDGQSILVPINFLGDNLNTTVGTAGSLASSDTRDIVRVVCTIEDTGFMVIRSIGQLKII